MATRRLEQLTPEQEARFAEFREKWLRIGLSTEPADRKRAEEGMRMAYRAVNLEPPRLFLWLRSPFEGAVCAAMLRNFGDQVWDQVRDQVGAQVGAPVGAQAWAQ